MMGKPLRKVALMYPDIAARELVANRLIHQNYSMQETSSLIEFLRQGGDYISWFTLDWQGAS